MSKLIPGMIVDKVTKHGMLSLVYQNDYSQHVSFENKRSFHLIDYIE